MKTRTDTGQVMLIVAIIFVAISMTVIFSIVTPVLAQIRNANRADVSRQSYFLAEAGVEDVIYRLKNNMQVSSTENLSLNGGSADISITDSVDGKTVSAEGLVSDNVRKVQTKIILGTGASFNYAVQTGNGGFEIGGGSTLNGNVYSNGYIIGKSGVTINGNATAANSSPLSTSVSNDSPLPPDNNIVFGDSNGTQDFAQSFEVSQSAPLSKISVYIKRTSSQPSNITARLVADDNGEPDTSTLDSATLNAGLTTTLYGWVDVVFGSYYQLQPNTKYWIVLDAGSNSNKYYTIGGNNSYVDGEAMLGRYNNQSWGDTSPSGLDGYFKIYTGGVTGKIEGQGGSQWWQPLNVTGDSWANEINYTKTTGTNYCQTGYGNYGGEPYCDTSRQDPPAQNYPVSEANINAWKAEAESGWTRSGNLSIGWQGTTTGPIKVDGDLSLNGGGTLTQTGTIWVTGDVTVSGGGKIYLDSSYGNSSGVLIADGEISISGNGQFQGSGQSGSYPIVITTSDSDNAISITGGSGAVVLVAQNGTLQMNGGTSVRAMTANKIYVTGGGQIDYDSGLADLTTSSSPSGGWNIQSWDEVE